MRPSKQTVCLAALCAACESAQPVMCDQPVAVPMTLDRARELAPQIQTGLVLSTTHVFGDCRGGQEPALDECGISVGPCERARSPLRVIVVPSNVSIPLSGDCLKGARVEDLSPLAAFDGRSSELGEVVIPLAPGAYTMHLSHDDVCADCGVSEAEGCLIDIGQGELVVGPLVLDRAFR